MKILVCSEYNEHSFLEQTAKTITAATKLGTDIDILLCGHNIEHIANSGSFAGVNKVLYADNPVYAHGNAENISALLFHLLGDYDAVLVPATTYWKNILPRTSAMADMMMMSDIMQIHNAETYERPIYAGNAIATLVNKEPKKIMTVRTTVFKAAETTTQTNIVTIDFVPSGITASEFISSELSKQDRPELTVAKTVISGGRGMGSSENFKLIEAVADKIGAAIGASRAAVDAGFVPNDYQVGQTGKVVAPDLYIAVGISGAIQHLAGMKDSKVIVAINKDEDAPIFNVADYGLVMDLFQALPLLQEELTKIGYK